MDVQDRESNSRGSGDGDDMKFVLCAERYLIGHDIRGIVHLEAERFESSHGVTAKCTLSIERSQMQSSNSICHQGEEQYLDASYSFL